MAKRHDATGRSTTKERFVGIPRYIVMGTDAPGIAYRSLSSNARSALFQIAGRYNGSNNGNINASARAVALEMSVSKSTAARAIDELVKAGFVEITAWSKFDLKQRLAQTYRLTWAPCDRTNQLPSKAFAKQAAKSSQNYFTVPPVTRTVPPVRPAP